MQNSSSYLPRERKDGFNDKPRGGLVNPASGRSAARVAHSAAGADRRVGSVPGNDFSER